MRIDYKNLKVDLSNRERRTAEIKKTAEEICKRRRTQGKSLRNKADTVNQERMALVRLLKNMQEHLSACSDESQKNQVCETINKLKNALEVYSDNLNSLATRFENSKIRVLSFGFKSQGKSLFTRMYTHINDDNIVRVKGNTDEDQTGTTNIIRHNSRYSSDNPHITVYFREESQILELVNNALKGLRSLIEKTTIPTVFSSYSQFSNFLSSDKKRAYEIIEKFDDIDHTIPTFDSAKSLLLSIFNSASDFSMVGKGSLVLKSSAEMATYNDMQAKLNQRYLSVDHIDIELNLRYDGMFENFEICDTKGLSEDAGGSLIEDDLVNDINHADAIFSIQKIQQDGGMKDKFVAKVKSLANPQRLNGHIKSIQNRHFSIANVYSNIDEKNVLNYENKINQNNLANIIYVGMLVDGEYNGDKIVAQEFVDALMLHMIGAIVETTATLDNELVRACFDDSQKVNDLLLELKSQLSNLSNSLKEGKDYAEYIRDNVDDIRLRVLTLLFQYAKDNKFSIENENNIVNKSGFDATASGNAYEKYRKVKNSSSVIDQPVSNSEVDTSKYYRDHEKYEEIKSKTRSIYYALTHNEAEVSGWDVSQEINNAVLYLLKDGKYIIPERDKTDRCRICKSNYITVNGVSPKGDVQTIGSSLETLHHNLIVNRVGENLAKFRKVLSEAKKKDIVSIYQIIFNQLHISEIYEVFSKLEYQDLLECPIDNPTIKKMCSYAKKNLDNADSYTPLPTSFKFMYAYFQNVKDADPQSDGRCVLEYSTIEKALTLLIEDCKDSLAYEIESKSPNGKTPIEVCLKELIDFLDNRDCLDGFVQMFTLHELNDEYLNKLEAWRIITPEDRKEVKENKDRSALRKGISAISESPSISTVY